MIQQRATSVQDPTQIDHTICEEFTEKHLQTLRHELEQTETQLANRKRRLQVITPELMQHIEQFVQNHFLTKAENKSKMKIVVVDYDYNEKVIEKEFLFTNPNQEQIQMFHNVIKAKHKYETSKAEVDILKQRVHYKQLPGVLNDLQLPAPLFMNDITTQHLRMAVYNRHQRAIQQARSELMFASIIAAEAKVQENQYEFDQIMYRMEQTQEDPVADARFTSKMMSILQRYLKSTEERVKVLLNLKVNFFVNAPTVVTNQTM